MKEIKLIRIRHLVDRGVHRAGDVRSETEDEAGILIHRGFAEEAKSEEVGAEEAASEEVKPEETAEAPAAAPKDKAETDKTAETDKPVKNAASA